jgi:hypothetical protein
MCLNSWVVTSIAALEDFLARGRESGAGEEQKQCELLLNIPDCFRHYAFIYLLNVGEQRISLPVSSCILISQAENLKLS